MSDRNMRGEKPAPKIEVGEMDDEQTPQDDAASEISVGGNASSENAGGAEGGKRSSAKSSAATEAELQALRAERDRLYDAWLRLSADFENYRKRVERDRQEFRDYALESFLRQLVPVLDNFDRAAESLPPNSPKGVVDGIDLIRKQLHDLLVKQGLTPIHSEGETFDPHLHEAVATEMRPDTPHHKVLEEVLRGYKLGKRVLRPAMVKVSVKPQDSTSDEQDEDLP